jgi:hypothetical protein
MRRWINTNRWFVAVTALVFLCALSNAPLLGAGWFWGLGNGLGLAALCCLAWLCLDTRRGGKIGHHQQLGYWACALLAAHIAWFLLGDTTTWQYLKTSAPGWMWSGWLALLLVLVMVISSGRAGHGLCLDCHYRDPELSYLMEQQFHDLCRGCHEDKRLQGDKSGPLRHCSDCHKQDFLP